MSKFSYLVKEGFKNVWNNRIMSIASIGVLISCLILTGAATLFSLNVEQLVETVGQTNETTVYLDMSATELEAVFTGKEIDKLDNVTSTRFLSKDDAIMQYKESLGDEVFAGVIDENNPLPHAIIVVMDDLSKYDQTVDQIMKIDRVDKVSNHSKLAKTLTDISNLVNVICIGVVSALMIISLFIIANTIRATMYSRRFEISIMKSVGATNSFVRMPFLVEGMTIGFISAVVSTLLMWLLYDGLTEALTNFIQIDTIPFATALPYVAGSFLVAGVLVGAFGSIISIRKYLKMEGNEILGW